ncbi:hypothetical protein ACFPVX_12085 [Cohnella faecalis]|uniref:hypothetical protein n=1 Tax=Cohnella faecalis TaxID=2315694 RepID=UPI003610DCAF
MAKNKKLSQRGIVRLTTDAYDAFTGWDWFVDPSTHLSIGSAKEGFLSNNGFKVHPIDPDEPEPWTKGEYFCDPDTMIVAMNSSSYDISYASFLDWDKDNYLSSDRRMARLSTKYRAGAGMLSGLPKVDYDHNRPMQLDIRLDLSLYYGKRFIEANVTITNKYEEAADVLFIYQDGAFMWMPDQNQDNVIPVFVNDNGARIEANDRFQVAFTGTDRLITGTYHPGRGIFSGIYTDNQSAHIGMLPYYLLFTENAGDSIDLKFTDDRPRSMEEIIVSMYANKEEYDKNAKQYKIRSVSFPVKQLQPGQTVSLRFFLIGFETDANLSLETLAAEIIRQLP